LRAAAVALVVFALVAESATAARSALVPQADGVFCSSPPQDVDSRIAAAVDALSVSAPGTPPIAILDTGVDGGVPEIGGRLVSPFDATTGGTDGSDMTGHGTEVAGIAAGAAGRIAGVSPTSPIMPVRVFNQSGESTAQWLVGGINWAVMHGAAVVNISAATPAADVSAVDTAALTRAITDAFNKRVLVVAAAGNEGSDVAEIPAALPHVLVVGASDLTGVRATFSNTGPWIDLVSPAASLLAPLSLAFCPGGYGLADGTSFAAPAVAGAAALLAQLRPELSAQQRFDVLRSSAHDEAPSGRDDETGFGMLDVAAAVHAAAPALESSPEVDDDPYYVRGANAKGHPLLLTKTHKVRLVGEVSPAKDPDDLYRVRLKKGERFYANATASGSDSLIGLGFWKPTVGNFDVSNGNLKQEIVSSNGFSKAPALSMRAKSTGTYYVSVEAPDVTGPDDTTAVVPITEPYRLVLSKTPAPKKTRSKKRH
jgi:Subtilase family